LSKRVDTKGGQYQQPAPLLSEPAPGGSINYYGSGAVNANAGSGTTNNNTGSGKQYIGQNLYFD